MGQALYRKYRSKSLSEIVGQEHITKTLANALKQGSISHAYLFTGPRGVGKTSVARILAHAVNELPYEDKSTHLDIIEIDAASNRRIDEIRELRERINNAPTGAKYKVYIIDEVHMLTKEAFNALLKTLEEPPAHVIFILATTEAHKLPDTIISRTQRFTFRPINEEQAVRHLASIAKQEKIDVTDEALELIARHGDGSFRDSISLLDQAAAHGKQVDAAAIKRLLGEIPDKAVADLIEAVDSRDTAGIIRTLQDLRDQGIQPGKLAKQLSVKFRQRLMSRSQDASAAEATRLMQKLLEVPVSHDPAGLLELILIEAALNSAKPTEKQEARGPDPGKATKKKSIKESSVAKPETIVAPPKIMPRRPDQKTLINDEDWRAVLDAVKTRHNTLYSLVRMGKPTFSDSGIELAFDFPFHQKRLCDEKNKVLILSVIHEVTGRSPELTCVLLKSAAVTKETRTDKAAELVDSISNIFGPSEVLE